MISRRQFSARASLAFAHDVVAAGVAWLAAFWLRFNLEMPPEEYARAAVGSLPAVLLVHVLAFWLLGLYRGLWRYASLPDLQRILIAVGVAALAMPALITLWGPDWVVPRSVYLISPVLLLVAMGGSRLLYRAWKERALLGMVRHPGAAPVLVLGAGVVLHRPTARSSEEVALCAHNSRRALVTGEGVLTWRGGPLWSRVVTRPAGSKDR